MEVLYTRSVSAFTQSGYYAIEWGGLEGGGGCRGLLEVTGSDLSELLFSYFPLCLCEWLVLNECPMESGHSERSQLRSGEEPAAALSPHP